MTKSERLDGNQTFHSLENKRFSSWRRKENSLFFKTVNNNDSWRDQQDQKNVGIGCLNFLVNTFTIYQ